MVTETPLHAFRKSFEALGYGPIPMVKGWSRGDIWYSHHQSTPDVMQVAVLEYKPTSKSYQVKFGVCNSDAIELMRNSLPLILEFLHPVMRDSKLFQFPCWTLFFPGRTFVPGVWTIPDPLDRDNWAALLKSLVDNFLEPIFWQVRNIEGIEELLFQNDPPFEWMASGSIIRVAEIIALSTVRKGDLRTTKENILMKSWCIEKSVRENTNIEMMVDLFINEMNRKYSELRCRFT
jgi:hypothetical protein